MFNITGIIDIIEQIKLNENLNVDRSSIVVELIMTGDRVSMNLYNIIIITYQSALIHQDILSFLKIQLNESHDTVNGKLKIGRL